MSNKNTTTEKAPRVFKTDRWEDIALMLEGKPVKHNTSLPTALDFIAREREHLANKNTKKDGEKKMTPLQVENEKYKALILDYLRALPADTEGLTCTELAKAIPECADFTPSKTNALLSQMYMDKYGTPVIERREIKGKARFRALPVTE